MLSSSFLVRPDATGFARSPPEKNNWLFHQYSSYCSLGNLFVISPLFMDKAVTEYEIKNINQILRSMSFTPLLSLPHPLRFPFYPRGLFSPLFIFVLCQQQVLRDGAEAADEVASETLGWAKEAMGIPSLKDFQD